MGAGSGRSVQASYARAQQPSPVARPSTRLSQPKLTLILFSHLPVGRMGNVPPSRAGTSHSHVRLKSRFFYSLLEPTS